MGDAKEGDVLSRQTLGGSSTVKMAEKSLALGCSRIIRESWWPEQGYGGQVTEVYVIIDLQ